MLLCGEFDCMNNYVRNERSLQWVSTVWNQICFTVLIVCLVIIWLWSKYEVCSNETRSETVLSEGVGAVTKGPHERWGRHPTDAQTDKSPPQRTPCAAAGTTAPPPSACLRPTPVYGFSALSCRGRTRLQVRDVRRTVQHLNSAWGAVSRNVHATRPRAL
jgi:hypothetical protein